MVVSLVHFASGGGFGGGQVVGEGRQEVGGERMIKTDSFRLTLDQTQ